MIRSRASALAFTTAFVGASVLSGLVAMPLAHATELDDIAAVVKGNRPATCPPLVYNGALEGAAQAYARSENPVDGQPGGYDGKTLAFLGSGDPQAAAVNSAFSRGAGGLVTNCDYTDFGVGFIRYEDGQPLGAGNRRGDDLTIDVVTIVFGAPPKAAPKAPDVPVTPQTTPCEGSAPVPVGTPCPVVAKVEEPPSPNSITMEVRKAGSGKVDVAFTNSSKVAGKCDYVATATSFDPLNLLPTVNESVDVKANGTGVIRGLTDPRPLGLRYHLEATCTGDFNGGSVPLGSPSTDL
jgi:hypothetical protein